MYDGHNGMVSRTPEIYGTKIHVASLTSDRQGTLDQQPHGEKVLISHSNS